ncbi:unnamed protein product [Bursaphelenchus xylophilus]|uniref:(pine wood nematode) hypothetical protein n=1 Tax=Bursaphelenchus xylophilus TaxID=6326 RepID=A0A1I7SUY9_BURXY|nr:unnamed protein product [Bursaphelenchus xylophilus]CAG9100627.1 unnamed protein product [Bursaphelenchus xylophilus]
MTDSWDTVDNSFVFVYRSEPLSSTALDYFGHFVDQSWEFDANASIAVQEKFFRDGHVGDRCELLISHPFYLATGPGLGMNIEYWKDVKFLLVRMKSEHISVQCTLDSDEVDEILKDIDGLKELKTVKFTCLERQKSCRTETVLKYIGDRIVEITADKSIIPFIHKLPHLKEFNYAEPGEVDIEAVFGLAVPYLNLKHTEFVRLTEIGEHQFTKNSTLNRVDINTKLGELEKLDEKAILKTFEALKSLNPHIFAHFQCDMVFYDEKDEWSDTKVFLKFYQCSIEKITAQAKTADIKASFNVSAEVKDYPDKFDEFLEATFPDAKITLQDEDYSLDYDSNGVKVNFGVGKEQPMM